MQPKGDRLSVLAKVRRIVGDRSSQAKVMETMIFCIADGELIPEARFWQKTYTHEGHTHDRALIFDPKTKWYFRDDGELVHFSVGAIMWRQDGPERRYCLFRRRTHPIGHYTIPAGHLEMGEVPQEAALREVYEETQLGVLSIELYQQEEVEDECRRGANFHVWNLYLCQCIGEPRMSDEADVIGWFTRDEIINELKLTRPTAYFLAKFFRGTPRADLLGVK
jgi:ADP-ribose pyrophosphatase YjhB (NUDIX family)